MPIIFTRSDPPQFAQIGSAGGGVTGFTPASGFGASGTSFTDGASLTITRNGGGWGTKPNGAAPAWICNFGRNGAVSHPRASTGTSADGTSPSSGSTRIAPNDTHALVTTHDTFYGGSWYKGATLSSPTGKMYSLVKHNMGFDDSGTLATSNWKFYRPQQSGGKPNIFCGIGNNGAGVHSGLIVETLAGGTMDGYSEYDVNSWWTIPATTAQWDTWEASLLDSSSTSAHDGDVEFRKNGKIYRGLGTHLFRNRETGDAGVYNEMHWVEKDNAFGTADVNRCWASRQIVDDSWFRVTVEMSSRTSTGAALAIEYCVCSTVADSSITLTLWQGSFSVGSQVDLIVTDNNGTRTTAGTGVWQ